MVLMLVKDWVLDAVEELFIKRSKSVASAFGHIHSGRRRDKKVSTSVEVVESDEAVGKGT